MKRYKCYAITVTMLLSLITGCASSGNDAKTDRKIPNFNQSEIGKRKALEAQAQAKADAYNQKSWKNLENNLEEDNDDIVLNDEGNSLGNKNINQEKNLLTNQGKQATYLIFRDDFDKTAEGYQQDDDIEEEEEIITQPFKPAKTTPPPIQEETGNNEFVIIDDDEEEEEVKSDDSNNYFIQIGAFQKFANAVNLEKKAKDLGELAVVSAYDGTQKWYKVLIGPLKSDEIEAVKLRIKAKLLINKTIVITEDSI